MRAWKRVSLDTGHLDEPTRDDRELARLMQGRPTPVRVARAEVRRTSNGNLITPRGA